MTDIDFNARYTVERFGPGIAFFLTGHSPMITEVEDSYEDEETGETFYTYDVIVDDDPNMVIAVMVGDDVEWHVGVDELTKIDGPVCSCGQTGCGWHLQDEE